MSNSPIFTSGATPEQARLQERFLKACGSDSLPSNGPYTSGAIPEQETSVCDGSDSLRKGTVPKTAHNEGADPRTELEKVKHCFAARLLVGVLPLLSGLPSCGGSLLLGPRLGLSALEGSVLRFFQEKGEVPRTDHFLTGIPPCRLQYWAAITSEVTPEHGLVDKVLFVLSPSSYALWTVYEMAGPERSDGCIFSGLWFPYDVAASLWPAVAAASLPLLPLYSWVSFLVRTSGFMELLVVAWHPILVLRYSSPRWDLWECVFSSV